MHPRSTTPTAWLLVASVSLAANVARAEPLPADLSIGGGAHVSATIADGSTHIELRVGPRVLETWEVPGELTDLALEPAASAGRAVTVVRGRGGAVEVAGIIDTRPRPHWIWRGRLDLHGDPGERVADALERRDIDADGRPDLIVGQRREGVAPCGAPPQLLFARALDGRGALRPVQPVLDLAGVSPLTGTAIVEAHPAPVVRGARFTIASSQLGAEEDASALGPPLGLGDDRPETGWAEGRGESGAGEVLRGHWSGPPVAALVLRGGPGASLPRRFVLALDTTRWVVSLPPELGDAARVTLPAPSRASCISLTLADAEPRGTDAHVGFAEIAIYSVADGERGIEALVDELVADGADGDRTVGWLAAAGTPALDALAASWERLAARGRRRALRVATALNRDAEGPAVTTIRAMRARAAVDADQAVADDAIGALATGATEDRVALFEVARGGGPSADAAADALARTGGVPPGVWSAVVAMEPASWDRPALRSAVAQTFARDPSWRTEPSLSPGALAALALGLVEQGEGRELVAPLLEHVIATETQDALDFVVRFRVARAARGGSSAAIDLWLDGVARTATEWMLRAEAVEALGERAPRELLAVLLSDPYPRVRLSAARAVARRGGEHATLMALVRHDAWPLVRGYALAEVADQPEARELLLDALRDPASAMRARALELLRTRRGADATPHVLAILEDAREWPHVTSRAIELAEAGCDEALGPGLVSVVERGARADARAVDLDSAQLALRVALRIGGPTADAARSAASSSAAAETFSVLLTRPPEPCGAGRGTAGADARSAGVPSAR